MIMNTVNLALFFFNCIFFFIVFRQYSLLNKCEFVCNAHLKEKYYIFGFII